MKTDFFIPQTGYWGGKNTHEYTRAHTSIERVPGTRSQPDLHRPAANQEQTKKTTQKKTVRLHAARKSLTIPLVQLKPDS